MIRILFFQPLRHGRLTSSPLFPTRLSFSSSPPLRAQGPARTLLPPRPKPPPEEEIEEFFVKGSGPGGQKINKTSSAVQLRHTPTGIVVKSQATRSRSQNRKIARNNLAVKIDELRNGDQSRIALVGAFKKKKSDSSAKKSRRKYKKLEENMVKDKDEPNVVDGELEPPEERV